MPEQNVTIELVLIKNLYMRPEGCLFSQDHLHCTLLPIAVRDIVCLIPYFLQEPMTPRRVSYTKDARVNAELVPMSFFAHIKQLPCPCHSEVITWVDHILNPPVHICDDGI
eukprot:CAMPEP_0184647472 /NCGR_PEP_ID=MMETSP0308-20130426/4414_1 /TAXON_ID=38269 /ORGANISM="Gloeochaete witrockiana, Strain SAG 46.84" /LENGTH=110 /DNA_ID=CAMNT_0027078467 /DNA_START=530 /DNA_END=862 /DNA_ORIENTATION=+